MLTLLSSSAQAVLQTCLSWMPEWVKGEVYDDRITLLIWTVGGEDTSPTGKGPIPREFRVLAGRVSDEFREMYAWDDYRCQGDTTRF